MSNKPGYEAWVDDSGQFYNVRCPKHGLVQSSCDECEACMKISDEEDQAQHSIYMNSIAALCYKCPAFFIDEGSCPNYPGMPLELFGRKKKCKHYQNELDRWNNQSPEDYEDYEN
jgi:hypothetical protein